MGPPHVDPKSMESLRSARTLRKATDAEIHDMITKIYDEAEKTNSKPPNVKEIGPLAKQRLDAISLEASAHHIQNCADAEKHKVRRRKPGATVASEKRSAPK
jgi:hypothetical protein